MQSPGEGGRKEEAAGNAIGHLWALLLGREPGAGDEGVGTGTSQLEGNPRTGGKDPKLALPTASSRGEGWVAALDTGASAGQPWMGEW